MVNIAILVVSVIMTSMDTLFVNLALQLTPYEVFYLQTKFLQFQVLMQIRRIQQWKIRLYHECEGWIKKSDSRIAV